MIWLDYIVLLALLLLTAAAAWRQHFRLRLIAVLTLVITGVFFEMGLGPIARGVVAKRTREGRWSKEYGDGVIDMMKTTIVFRPYRLISVAGLAFFAVRYIRMGRLRANANVEVPHSGNN